MLNDNVKGQHAAKRKGILGETRKELRRQVLLAFILISVGATMVLAVEAPLIWLAIGGCVIGLGALLVYSARRGLWLMVWRGTCLLLGFVGLSTQTVFIVNRHALELPRNLLISFCVAATLLGIIYHYFNNIP